MTQPTASPQDRRYVLHVTRPRCANPECGSTRLKVYGGTRRPDGGRLQYAKCWDCGAEHKLIVEYR